MDIENPNIIQRKQATVENLSTLCWNVANRLSGRQWGSDATFEVKYSRTVGEKTGRYIGSSEDASLAPTFKDMRIDFYADKLPYRNEDGGVYLAEEYSVVSSITQTVKSEDVPPYVLDRIFTCEDEDDEDEDDEYKDDVHHHEHAHDIYGELVEGVERDNLDEVKIQKQQTINYEISEDGYITNFSLSFKYMFDDIDVYEVEYDDEDGLRAKTPLVLHDSREVVDLVPNNLVPLTKDEIEDAVKDLDKQLQDLLFEDYVRESVELGAQTTRAHVRQAMGLISLAVNDLFRPSLTHRDQ